MSQDQTRPQTQQQTQDPRLVTRADLTAVVVRGEAVPMSGIREFFDAGFTKLGDTLQSQGAAPQSAAFAHHLRQPTETIDVELGFAADRTVQPTGRVQSAVVPGGEAAELIHVGGYDSIGSSWQRLADWAEGQGLRPSGRLLEEYLTEPAPDADPTAMRTRLTMFLDANDRSSAAESMSSTATVQASPGDIRAAQRPRSAPRDRAR